jgi:hypothetical protein
MKPLFPSLAALALAAACSHRPPEDFVPDPGLLARIRSIAMSTPSTACPGQGFAASYTAILDDGSRIPFASRYDRKHPPRLHVVFLDRTSPEAIPLEDGGWAAERDPLASVMRGFRLRVALRDKPAVADSVTITPNYDCLRHSYTFSGSGGQDGPDVVVRLGIVRSPFVDRLLVAQIEVADAPPVFVLADAAVVPPSDWLILTSAGGRGARGQAGNPGAPGANGVAGCPGQDGLPGGRGGNGSRGGNGGRGGRFTIMAPTEEPFLAGLVDARVPGGEGGPGGPGAAGGNGGQGGAGSVVNGAPCASGLRGQAGMRGSEGPTGEAGAPGGRPQILTLPQRDVFGTRAPGELVDLLDYARGLRRP